MRNWLSYSIAILFLSVGHLYSQSWIPDTNSFHSHQYAFDVKLIQNGPLGKDWICGGYLDSDSLRRNVAYREGGKWIALPFSGYNYNMAYDIVMYGDTLYISGHFQNLILDKDSSSLPATGILKYYNDSLWAAPLHFILIDDMATRGDTLLLSGTYHNPPNIIHPHCMGLNGGTTWQYPYAIKHPTESIPDFGASAHIEILNNGDILTLNNRSPSGSPFKGLSRWDGQQWHSYGNGLFGSGHHALDFDFYKGELYMGGTFAQINTFYGDTISFIPQNPGNSIVRWDGTNWQNLANGILEGGVSDIFVNDSVLYCIISAGNPSYHQCGDAKIPYLAGWDGHQWCGTPTNFKAFPRSGGFANDTLFVSFKDPVSINGGPTAYMFYFDGDYVNNPYAICSTLNLGVEEAVEKENRISIYPNPATSKVQIELSGTGIKLESIKVYDCTGRCVFEETSPVDFEAKVDISFLSSGVYVIRINDQFNKQLVKL